MTFKITIPTPSAHINISIKAGDTLFFVGANGCGKTRLAAKIEETLGLRAHRIAAHRALSLNPFVTKISRKQAQNKLLTGFQESSNIINRIGDRWSGKLATHLLNDYDSLLQLLFAEQNDTALETHIKARREQEWNAKAARFETLQGILEKLLPKRKLNITGNNITVLSKNGTEYSAEEMSDGERAIFYLIGQVLCAPVDSVVIFDEPELHIHRSILSKLWDELQSVRPDCGFIMISHDLEFVAARTGQKYLIKEYTFPDQWELQLVPEDTGFDEELTTLVLGSRHPILFVEGDNNSLDMSIYRQIYSDWKVIPRGSCDNVIQSVKSISNLQDFTRITCAGIIDADDRTTEEIEQLRENKIHVLSVSEIENVILLPEISRAICQLEAFDEVEINHQLSNLHVEIFSNALKDKNIKQCEVRYLTRRLGRIFKDANLNASRDTTEVISSFDEKIKQLDLQELTSEFSNKLSTAIKNKDINTFLSLYDNKSMIASAATHLTTKTKRNFEAWIVRQLGNPQNDRLRKAFIDALPKISLEDESTT